MIAIGRTYWIWKLVNNDVFGLVYQMSIASGHQVELRVTRRSKLAGVMRDGGSSQAVLEYLQSAGGYRAVCEIRQHVPRSHGAVSWALIFLRHIGAIECAPDVVRNARYLRYRAVK